MSDERRTPRNGADEPATEVDQLRRVRHALDQVLRELRLWIDLLRHKASALRAVSGVPPQGEHAPDSPLPPALTPGSLDPEALGDALAAAPPAPAPGRPTRRPRLVGDDADDLLNQAHELWETVADPQDVEAARDLADAADRLADRLEDSWHVTRDQLRTSGEVLARALASVQRTDDPEDRQDS